MHGNQRRALAIALGILAASSCHCHQSVGITNTNTPVSSCADLDGGDACDPDAGANGGCADHSYCDPIHKSDSAAYSQEQSATPPLLTSSGASECSKCYYESRRCQTNADCCPGQQCNASLNLCFDCYNLSSSGACGQSDCTSDAECVTNQGPGHICQTFNSPDGGAPQIQGEETSNRCTYPLCHQDSDCTSGSTCFPANAKTTGYCVPQTPCNGGCTSGTACAITDDLCSAVPPGVASCQQTCQGGYMLVFVDQSVPTGVYDACNLPAVACECAVLPPLQSDDLGRYSSLAAAGGQVWVSAYDGEYENLIAYHFSPDGGLIDLEYVDGVPDGGKVVADPSGPRGGVAAIGTNVGEWTSAVIGPDGQPRVSYYDVQHKSLKFAQRQLNGTWLTEFVDGWDGTTPDGGGGDVGSYTSIAMTPGANSAPVISYFQAAGPTAGDPLLTAVKLAVANKPNPAGPSDWTISVVDSADKPIPPCFPATCSAAETCVGTPPGKSDGGPIELPDGGCEPVSPPDNGGECMLTASKCTSDADGGGSCSSTQACVETDAGPECMDTFATESFADFVQGVGLMTSLALDSAGNADIAYYDRLHGDLRFATGPLPTGPFTVTTIDGSDPESCDDTGNVGLFPSLKIGEVGGQTLAIAYQDQDSEQLLYWTGPTPAFVAPEDRIVVDTGTIQAPAPNNGEVTPMFIGAGVSLAFGQSGTAYFAYQNQTAISLRLSSVPPGCGVGNDAGCAVSVIDEWATAPEGFYSQVAIDGTQGYASSAQIKALVNGVDDTLIMQTPLQLP